MTLQYTIMNNITTQEAYNLIQTNKNNPDFIILDVRTEDEYNESHIEKAVNMDCFDNDFENSIDELNKELTYLTYCHSGSRSITAAELMESHSFKNIYNMRSGFAAWQKAGFPVVK